MATEKQIAANQANSKKSTGPRTDEGKSRSRLNAMRHGLTGQVTIMTERDREAQKAFMDPLIASLNPTTPQEEQIANLIAANYWKLHRANAFEDNILLAGALDNVPVRIDADEAQANDALATALAFRDNSKQLSNLALYTTRIANQTAKFEKQLKTLQKERKDQETKDLEEAVMLAQYHEFHGVPFDPAKNGFDFSPRQIAVAVERDRVRRGATIAKNCDYRPGLRTHKPMAA